MTHPHTIVTFTNDISHSQFHRWQPKTCPPIDSHTRPPLDTHRTDRSLAMIRDTDLPAVIHEFESSVNKMVNGHDYLARKRTELERRVRRLQVLVWLLLAVLLVILLTGCTATTPTPSYEPAYRPPSSPLERPTDPYVAYQEAERANPDWPSLTRDDAQLRAFLGCDRSFAPGTQDAVLQELYGPDVC